MYKFALLLIIVAIIHSQSRYADFPTEKDVIIHQNIVDDIIVIPSNIPLVEMTKSTSSALPRSIHDAELTELPKVKLVSLPLKKEIKYRIHDTYKKDTDSLSDWDKFCKATYQMAINIKDTFPNLAIDTIEFYDALMKVTYAECKYYFGIAEGYSQHLAKRGKTKAIRDAHRSLAYRHGINWRSDARGIFQFMPKYRKGTKKRRPVPNNINEYKLYDQVTYGQEYLIHKIRTQWTTDKGGNLKQPQIKEFIDVYCLVFAPKYADDPKNAVMYSSGKAYTQNKGYDRNNDGKIVKGEVENYIINKHFK